MSPRRPRGAALSREASHLWRGARRVLLLAALLIGLSFAGAVLPHLAYFTYRLHPYAMNVTIRQGNCSLIYESHPGWRTQSQEIAPLRLMARRCVLPEEPLPRARPASGVQLTRA